MFAIPGAVTTDLSAPDDLSQLSRTETAYEIHEPPPPSYPFYYKTFDNTWDHSFVVRMLQSNQVQRDDLLAELDQIAAKPPGWDGYGADPISPECVSNTRTFIAALPQHIPDPDLIPNPNGTITLEWEADQGTLEVEIGNTKYSVLIEVTDKPQFFLDELSQDMPMLVQNALAELFPNRGLGIYEDALITTVDYHAKDGFFTYRSR